MRQKVPCVMIAGIMAVCVLGAFGCCCPENTPLRDRENGSLRELEEKLADLCWVAYAPTNFDPSRNLIPSNESIRADLEALRQARFTGIVTYSTDIVDDISQFPFLAESVGMKGIILGIWDPTNNVEIAKAELAGRHNLVLGFCVGNEGLDQRYDLKTLSLAMDKVRRETLKPVATTEEIDDYGKAELLTLGDWVFPNVHPYWHNITEPIPAVEWTLSQYNDLKSRIQKPIMFKEVGLPTKGDPRLSEDNQTDYYQRLAATDTRFVYFEAFDQPWKTHASVEPHWGLLTSDRRPKRVVSCVCR
jgi:exo-beta-1,3-glucanase (GH17 family)